jgi:hypothetical protein
MVLVTTLVTPPILRSLFARDKPETKGTSHEDRSLTATHDLPDEEAN